MPWYVLECEDKPGHTEVRQQNRPTHLEYIGQHKAHVVVAGPLLAADEATPVGSLFILEYPDRAAAEAFAKDDPYAKAGLFARTAIKPWRLTILRSPP